MLIRAWILFWLLIFSFAISANAQSHSNNDPDPFAGLFNAYVPFARYALEQAEKREGGKALRNAILVPKVSLTDPRAMACDAKPLAVLIDVDIAAGTPSEIDIEPQSGFGTLLNMLRKNDIRIAWLSSYSKEQLTPVLDVLRKGDDPVFSDQDILLFGHPAYRKQEQRWMLAQDHCVIAMAGDRRNDFDELYDYLKNPDYAIRLEAFIGKGWFLAPPPVAAVDTVLIAQTPQKENTP
jgi:hypothetical protein